MKQLFVSKSIKNVFNLVIVQSFQPFLALILYFIDGDFILCLALLYFQALVVLKSKAPAVSEFGKTAYFYWDLPLLYV